MSGLVETDISGVGGLRGALICQLRQADQAGMGLIIPRQYEHECEKQFSVVRIFSHMLKELIPSIKNPVHTALMCWALRQHAPAADSAGILCTGRE